MKIKLLVAVIACLAIGACSKNEGNKEETKAGEEATQGTDAGKSEATPAAPSAPAEGNHQSLNQTTTNLAIEDNSSAHSNAVSSTQESDQKLNEMKQDMSNTANQIQGTTTSTDAASTDAHTHAED
ncbi:MAG: hypothetical protein AB7V32_05215 [Candidatus Berkiella sp.]